MSYFRSDLDDIFCFIADILASFLLLMVVGEINWVGSGFFAFYCPIEYMKFGIHKVEVMIVRVLSFQKENFFKHQPGTNNDAKCHSYLMYYVKSRKGPMMHVLPSANYAALSPNFTLSEIVKRWVDFTCFL